MTHQPVALDLGSRPFDKPVLVSGAFAAETRGAADSARHACATRHRLPMRRLHRADEL